MTLSHALLLILSGIAGGAISSLVGGAALVTYPVLLAIEIPPVVATMWQSRRALARQPAGRDL